MRGFQNRDIPISIEKWPIRFQKTQAPRILGVRSMWIYQNGAQVSYFLKVSKHYVKINFRTFFSDSTGWKICFRGSTSQLEILEKSEKNRKSVRGWRTNGGNHLKSIFWSLGGPCGQNESYTSLARPFFEEVVFLWSWPIFGWFLGNLILVDLCICDIAGEKHNILGK